MLYGCLLVVSWSDRQCVNVELESIPLLLREVSIRGVCVGASQY